MFIVKQWQEMYSIVCIQTTSLLHLTSGVLYLWPFIKAFDIIFCTVVSCWVRMEKDNLLTRT